MIFSESNTYISDLDIAINHIVNMEKLKDCSVLVTGATGTIGSFVADMLLRYNHIADAGITVGLAGRSVERLKARFPKARCLEYDLHCELKFCEKFDYVIHSAGNAHPAAFADDPVGTVIGNIGSTKRLLDYLCDNEGKRFLYLSSGEVYGKENQGLDEFDEAYSGYIDTLNPRYCYPISKRAAENLCISYHKQYGLETVIVRPCHTYGPNMTPSDSRAHAQFFRSAGRGDNILLKSAGVQMRSYIYSADCASAIITVLINGKTGEAYNIANANSRVTIAQLAEVIAREGNCKVAFDLPSDVDISRQNPFEKQVLSSTKLESLGWTPSFDIESGVSHTMEILRETQAV